MSKGSKKAIKKIDERLRAIDQIDKTKLDNETKEVLKMSKELLGRLRNTFEYCVP